MFERGFGSDLDGDLVCAEAADGDLAHAGEGAEVVAHLADGAFHGAFVGVAIEGENDGGEVCLEFLDDDAFGGVGEVLEGVDLSLDLVDRSIDVFVGFELDADMGRRFGDSRGDFLDFAEVADSVFDFGGEGAFDFIRGCAGIGGADEDGCGVYLGEELAADVCAEEDAAEEQGEHEEVGEDGAFDAEGRETHGESPAVEWGWMSMMRPSIMTSRLVMMIGVPSGMLVLSRTAHWRSRGAMSEKEPEVLKMVVTGARRAVQVLRSLVTAR